MSSSENLWTFLYRNAIARYIPRIERNSWPRREPGLWVPDENYLPGGKTAVNFLWRSYSIPLKPQTALLFWPQLQILLLANKQNWKQCGTAKSSAISAE